jgi:predicted nuclease with TOPRIM domain
MKLRFVGAGEHGVTEFLLCVIVIAIGIAVTSLQEERKARRLEAYLLEEKLREELREELAELEKRLDEVDLKLDRINVLDIEIDNLKDEVTELNDNLDDLNDKLEAPDNGVTGGTNK